MPLYSVFDHWEQMTYDPLKEGSPAYEIMMDVRKRKGLKPSPNGISECAPTLFFTAVTNANKLLSIWLAKNVAGAGAGVIVTPFFPLFLRPKTVSPTAYHTSW